jgi:hypothetical protein
MKKLQKILYFPILEMTKNLEEYQNLKTPEDFEKMRKRMKEE